MLTARQAFDAALKRLTSAAWIKAHKEDIAWYWWMAPIVGGMFRAGMRYERKRAKAKAD